MKPAAPVTSSLMPAPARPGTRRGPPARWAGGCRARCRAPSTPGAGRGAGTRPWCRARRGCSEPARAKISRANSNHEQEPEAATWWTPKSSVPASSDERLGEVAGEGRAADLVVDHPHLGPQPEHRLDEVLAAGAEQPRGARDEVARVGLGRRALARELGAPVRRERVDRVRLQVRLALGAVEDVVARHVDDRARGLGHVARAVAVDAQRLVLVLLGAVHVGPGGAVDRPRRRARSRRAPRRRSVTSSSRARVADRAGGAHHVLAEHPAGSDDDRPHRRKRMARRRPGSAARLASLVRWRRRACFWKASPRRLLWTLYMRASEARRPDTVLDDPRRSSCSSGSTSPSRSASAPRALAQWQALRARTFDDEVRRFLGAAPGRHRGRARARASRRSSGASTTGASAGSRSTCPRSLAVRARAAPGARAPARRSPARPSTRPGWTRSTPRAAC